MTRALELWCKTAAVRVSLLAMLVAAMLSGVLLWSVSLIERVRAALPYGLQPDTYSEKELHLLMFLVAAAVIASFLRLAYTAHRSAHRLYAVPFLVVGWMGGAWLASLWSWREYSGLFGWLTAAAVGLGLLWYWSERKATVAPQDADRSAQSGPSASAT